MLDAVLLACTSFMMAKTVSIFKTICAAAFGATYALSPLFESTASLYNPILKIGIAFIMVALAMGFSSFLEFLKTTFFFFMISFLAGGTAVAFNSIDDNIFSPHQESFLLIIFAVSSIAVFIKAGYGRLRTLFLKSACKLTIRISIAGKVCLTNALIDTGNELTSPITGIPIIIVNIDTVCDVLPLELIKANDEVALDKMSDEWKIRLQLVPYNALGVNGMLVAIRPDKIEIALQGSQEFTQVEALIGLAKEEFCREKDYKALVGAQLLPYIGGARV